MTDLLAPSKRGKGRPRKVPRLPFSEDERGAINALLHDKQHVPQVARRLNLTTYGFYVRLRLSGLQVSRDGTRLETRSN